MKIDLFVIIVTAFQNSSFGKLSCWFLLLLLLALTGCDSDNPEQPDSKTDQFIVYLNGQKIGASQRSISIEKNEGSNQKVWESKVTANFQRGGQNIRDTIIYRDHYDKEGKLLSCGVDEPEKTNRQKIGLIAGDQLIVKEDEKEVQTIKLTQSVLGFHGLEKSLSKQPMRQGEERTLWIIDSSTWEIAQLNCKAIGKQKVAFVKEQPELFQVNVFIKNESTPDYQRIVWLDENHQLQISETKVAELQMLEIAENYSLLEEHPSDKRIDFFDLTLVTLKNSNDLTDPPSFVQYEVTSQVSDLHKKIISDWSQSIVQFEGENQYQVTVRTVSTEKPMEKPDWKFVKEKFTDADLAASQWIQSDDPKIIEIAERIRKGNESDWEAVQAAEKWVHDYIEDKNYGSLFATSSEVLESKSGDCTEHAVLLAAILRAMQLPTRCVAGMIYVPEKKGFLFHLWNQVYLEDHWVPLDAVAETSGTDGTYIKVATSDLALGSSDPSLLAILNVMGQIKIKVLQSP